MRSMRQSSVSVLMRCVMSESMSCCTEACVVLAQPFHLKLLVLACIDSVAVHDMYIACGKPAYTLLIYTSPHRVTQKESTTYLGLVRGLARGPGTHTAASSGHDWLVV